MAPGTGPDSALRFEQECNPVGIECRSRLNCRADNSTLLWRCSQERTYQHCQERRKQCTSRRCGEQRNWSKIRQCRLARKQSYQLREYIRCSSWRIDRPSIRSIGARCRLTSRRWKCCLVGSRPGIGRILDLRCSSPYNWKPYKFQQCRSA